MKGSAGTSPGAGYGRIYEVVRNIPAGRVATYGQIARMAGIPRQARQVGYALHRLPEGTEVPWHRVINEKGGISLDPHGSGALQRSLLEAEGVCFADDGTVVLEHYRWQG